MMNRERNIFGQYRRSTADPIKRGRGGMSPGERVIMDGVKSEEHEAYMATYHEALQALAAKEIGRPECDRRLQEAKTAQRRAVHDAALRIEAARQPAAAVFAEAA